MPLGKYYCDFCDKQIQDTPSSRKRHLQGAQHQRARALYYDSINSSTGGGPDGTLPTRGVCHRFLRTGFCPYGDGCKYLHPKKNAVNQTQAILGSSSIEAVQSPIFLGILPLGGHLPGDMVKDRAGISWGNLPPSLRPPPEGGYPSLPIVDWG